MKYVKEMCDFRSQYAFEDFTESLHGKKCHKYPAEESLSIFVIWL